MEIKDLENALALSVTAIAGEHFFSAGMSSPWSTAKFATTAEDQAKVWALFKDSAIGSVAFALVVGAVMRSWTATLYGVAGAVVIIVWMWWEYDHALKGAM